MKKLLNLFELYVERKIIGFRDNGTGTPIRRYPEIKKKREHPLMELARIHGLSYGDRVMKKVLK